MKQKVSTRAIIDQDGKTLLLRRTGGRPSIAGMYELPGGRVHMNQQPEDAIKHAARIHLGVSIETLQLHDVMSFVDPDDRALQYVFIVYRATLKPVDKTIDLSHEYDRYIWKKRDDITREKLTQSTRQILGLQQIPFATGTVDVVAPSQPTNRLTSAVIYSDGGSRGNPGPSASGYVILDGEERVVTDGGAYLGVTTNNVAEYQSVYIGLERALDLGVKFVDFRMDSQLVVN